MRRAERRGFTLIELLVVMAIIALLAGILLPVFAKAREAARKTKARAEVKQLDVAWRSLLNDHRTWPAGVTTGSKFGMTSIQCKMLQGSNPKGVVYMEFSTNATASTGFLDPWGNLYQVSLDGTYKSQVTTDDGTVSRMVAVWSNGSVPGDPSYRIRSWE